MQTLKLSPIPAFKDNYLWLIHTDDSTSAWVVDPGDAFPVIEVLEQRGLSLTGILVTHYHPDHIGGVEDLVKKFHATVYGPASIGDKFGSRVVSEGDEVEVLGHRFEVIAVPGHTLDHVAYYQPSYREGTSPILLSGDTLFAGGCGRVFEGNFPMMYASLNKLASLPGNTNIYCAHEYTLTNLKFAQAVEATNQKLSQRVKDEHNKRKLNVPTVPSVMQLELDTNPFLRCSEPSIRQSANNYAGKNIFTHEGVFGILREWKDNFR